MERNTNSENAEYWPVYSLTFSLLIAFIVFINYHRL
jgi:hypothetical protein